MLITSALIHSNVVSSGTRDSDRKEQYLGNMRVGVFPNQVTILYIFISFRYLRSSVVAVKSR